MLATKRFVFVLLSMTMATAAGAAWKNDKPKPAASGEKTTIEQVRQISARLQAHIERSSGSLLRKANHPSALRAKLLNSQAPLLNPANARRSLLSSADWSVYLDGSNGTPSFLSRKSDTQLGKRGTVPTAEHAINFLTTNQALFRLQNPVEELRRFEAFSDLTGRLHVRYQRTHSGIPIWGNEISVHLDDAGVYAVNANYQPTLTDFDVDNLLRLDESGAIAVAEEALGTSSEPIHEPDPRRRFMSYDGPVAKKYIWFDRETSLPHLVWRVQIRPNFQDNWMVVVDANSGDILEKYNATAYDGPTTANATDLNGAAQTLNVYESGGTFFLIDGSKPIFQQNQSDVVGDPKGVLWTIDVRNQDLNEQAQIFHVTSANNTWTDPVAVSAHANVSRVFDYFFNTHGRQAIDNRGSTLISIIHVTQDGAAMDNAFWNGAAMAYGDGQQAFRPLAGGLDVAAHEMSHGVIQHTVNLEYKFQSGALNESFADVFGVMVDREDWQLGEDVVFTQFFPSGAMRDMQNPHNGGTGSNDNGWQPAHMNEFLNLTIQQDNGGVHVNSGIPNKACQLIGDAIGKDKTERIYYRILDARYLNSQSSFTDMRLAAIRAATDLHGDNSAEVNAVKAAFDGVGIVGDQATPPPPDTPAIEGQEWIAGINADQINTSLYLVKPVIATDDDIIQLTPTEVYTNTGNPIAVSDDGSFIVFIDTNNFLRVIDSDGTDEEIVDDQIGWQSVALSPDGSKLAATTDPFAAGGADKSIHIFDLINPESSKIIELYSPTTGEGVKANVVQFADAIDWDLSSQLILYDAFNSIPQDGGGSVDYWDVNLLDVANEVIVPLFPPQAENISIGNPSFAQTNDNFFVFDFIEFDVSGDVANSTIMAGNLFTGEVGTIEDNGPALGFARYSVDDSKLVFEQSDQSGTPTLRQISLAENRIQPAGASQFYVSEGQRPVWFALGQRPVTGVENKGPALPAQFTLEQNYPNPFNPETHIRYSLPTTSDIQVTIYDLHGRVVSQLVSGTWAAGEHVILWDGKDGAGKRVSSGVYFYKLEVNSKDGMQVLSKKMTYLK
jgi:Zn-dependent metalloprotease